MLTPDGVRHPIFANIAGFFPTRQGAAKTPGCRRWTAARASRARGPAPRCWPLLPADSGAMPVLAVQPLDRGRTAVFTGDTTRKWQQGPRALGQESPFLRFWGQMVRWLAGRGRHASRPRPASSPAPTRPYYEPGEPIHISAVVRDKRRPGRRQRQGRRPPSTGRAASTDQRHALRRCPARRPLRRRRRAAHGRAIRNGRRGPARRIEL